ncbi:MAG TPA: NfeD family protein [Micromonosporaceae bacterium]|nr:NfeD family protein [Micromonosporaceae bacterium]
MTSIFLVIGGIGLALLVLSLLLGDVFDLGMHAGGPFSLAAVSAFVGGFGFTGTVVATLLPDLGAVVAAGAGVVAAIPTTWLTVRLSRALMRMRTDPTLTRHDLVGSTGVVVTPIPQDGYGEVRLRAAGQQIKFNARAGQAIPVGAEVFVIDTPSETSVLVEPTEAILPDAG